MVEIRLVLREILRRVELSTTTAADEKQRAKHVTFVPHRGGMIHVRAIRDAEPPSQAATPQHCPASAHGSRDSPE
jgi:hypothetical protein